ncbi:MAG: hypothetical protein HZT43_19580 [Exiguobacterium profundum]|nr:MAG: hypothetical protein HZT43_19580 [Exiguobacterium profundum]
MVYDAAAHPDPTLTLEPGEGGATLMLDGLPVALVQGQLTLDAVTLLAA